MTFDWLQYLNLAKELVAQPATAANKDARLRAAIHLAYYAAFNLAKEHLQNKEGHSIPKTSEVHKYVSDLFQFNPDPLRQVVGEKLKKLKKFRNQADYVTFFPGLSGITSTALKLSEEVISDLSRL